MLSQPGHNAGGALIDLTHHLDLFTALRLARLSDTKSVHLENAFHVKVAAMRPRDHKFRSHKFHQE